MAILWRFDAVVAALIIVSLFIAIIAHHRTTRIRSITLLIILAVITIAVLTYPEGLMALAILLLIMALREVWQQWKIQPFAVLAMGSVGFALAFWHPTAVLIFPFIVAVIMTWYLPPRWTTNWSMGLFFSVLLGVGLAFFGLQDRVGVLTLVFLIQMNDAFSYLGGQLIGRHHVVPQISPGKTLEGYGAGLLGIILGLWVATLLGLLASTSVLHASILGVYIALAADWGDLYVSRLKRRLGIKDFGAILPGHGGILDRFGNVALAAPGFLLLWQAMLVRVH